MFIEGEVKGWAPLQALEVMGTFQAVRRCDRHCRSATHTHHTLFLSDLLIPWTSQFIEHTTELGSQGIFFLPSQLRALFLFHALDTALSSLVDFHHVDIVVDIVVDV